MADQPSKDGAETTLMESQRDQAMAAWLKTELATSSSLALRRTDTQEKIVIYIGGCDGASCVEDVQRATGDYRMHTLVGSGEWHDALRDDLARLAAQRGIDCLVAEYVECPHPESEHEVLSVRAIGGGSDQSLDWARIQIRPEREDAHVEGEFEAAARALLANALTRLARHGVTAVPVLSPQPRLSEQLAIRRELALDGIEYSLEIADNYLPEAIAGRRPDEDWRSHPVALLFHKHTPEQLPTSVPVRELRRAPDGRRLTEFITCVQDDAGRRRYSVSFANAPKDLLLTGTARSRKAEQLAASMARLDPTPHAEQLGVREFQHPTDASWLRHMLLRSLEEAFLSELHGP